MRLRRACVRAGRPLAPDEPDDDGPP